MVEGRIVSTLLGRPRVEERRKLTFNETGVA